MASSRSAIDEALSPDDLGSLSKMMFGEEDPPPSEMGPRARERVSHSSSSDPSGDAPPPKRTSSPETECEPESGPHGSAPAGSVPDQSASLERSVERPSFTIGTDQAATLRVLASAKGDPLGVTASEIAQCVLDLLGYNGFHPVAQFHGQTLEKGTGVPGPLIEPRQWEDLLAHADAMIEPEEIPCDGDTDTPRSVEARLACVCYLVQEALYEAGFGDGRRRRKRPLNRR